MEAALQSGTLLARDGKKIFYRSYESKSSLDTVVLLHGFAEHSGRYSSVVAQMVALPMNVLAIDFRGHGYSEGARGYIASLNEYIEDIDAAVNFAKRHFINDRVFLVAHSMGGLMASIYAEQKPSNLKGIVLSSPLFGVKLKVPQWKQNLGKIMSRLSPKFCLPTTIKGSSLTHDCVLAEEYDTDPLVFHKVRARWFTEILQSRERAFRIASQIRIPLLMQLSEEDNIVDCEQSKLWFAKCQSADRAMIGYSGFYHEIYNEIGREKPIADLVRWLQKRGTHTNV